MSNQLQEALADLKEMLKDTQHVSHPYTNAHIFEARRRAVRIGASLSGESHNKYMAVVEVGMNALACVQNRNSNDVIQKDGYVGVAGVEASTPRWEDRLESLEYSLASYGLQTKRNGDDGVIVLPGKTETVSASVLEARYGMAGSVGFDLEVLAAKHVRHAVAGTRLEDSISSGHNVLSYDDALLLLDLIGEYESEAGIESELVKNLAAEMGL